MLTSFTFVTGNPGKAEQLGYHLSIPVAHQDVDLLEIQSLDPHDVAEHKAREAYRVLGSPVLVEDTSLTFHALGRLPGPLIKWFLTELENSGLTRLLDGHEDRSATAEVVFCLYDGETARTFHGEVRGRIAERPRGVMGFGWDPIFVPDGHDRTWGEMSPAEQAATSVRRIALAKLEAELAAS
ncbi:non-canonical purine NTP pyrophosphatase [Solihabitans fulvus]|nr:non-canonical purine NTP pyrophosphatase [Solihabitans fulvus]